MSLDGSTVLYVISTLAIVTIVLVGVLIAKRRARNRSAELMRQFGPEYERALLQFGNRAAAERSLLVRSLRVRRFRFHELSGGERRRFEASWARIQAQFVDDPAVAAASANQLISEVMRARGYPTDDFEQRVEDLSVNYPTVVQHYRAAHTLLTSVGEGQLATESLRQAVVHYRVLFGELLQDQSRPGGAATPTLEHARERASVY